MGHVEHGIQFLGTVKTTISVRKRIRTVIAVRGNFQKYMVVSDEKGKGARNPVIGRGNAAIAATKSNEGNCVAASTKAVLGRGEESESVLPRVRGTTSVQSGTRCSRRPHW